MHSLARRARNNHHRDRVAQRVFDPLLARFSLALHTFGRGRRVAPTTLVPTVLRGNAVLDAPRRSSGRRASRTAFSPRAWARVILRATRLGIALERARPVSDICRATRRYESSLALSWLSLRDLKIPEPAAQREKTSKHQVERNIGGASLDFGDTRLARFQFLG